MRADTVADLLRQAGEACELARQAFASGDKVTGAAAIVLGAQLVQLAKIWQPIAS